jgi:hypothetical protein
MAVPERMSLNDTPFYGAEMANYGGGGVVTNEIIVPYDCQLYACIIHVNAVTTAVATFDVLLNGTDDGWDFTLPTATPANTGFVMNAPGLHYAHAGDKLELQSNSNADTTVDAYCSWIFRR